MLKVNEYFYSLQGEGYRAGHASIFIRLSDCDQTCGFCDTEFESGQELSNEELLVKIQEYPCQWIVWTGGEPTLQLTQSHVDYFKGKGYSQAIETNGNNRAPNGLDWVCVSPKVADHVVEKNFPDGVDELRYVRHANQLGVPEPKVESKHLYLSPRFDGNDMNKKNLQKCTELILENPKWKLSLQSHKLLNVL
ncbi:MAG: radical SAM protein [Parcubacteria group bacterium]|jgi:organic radical activating enzyme|nr:radical SAM protein [Parcubacteria group bacterium]|tara:strand:+ start:1365 stop:1943 length:579 start_codon:yes stop_codon:yes gene_type:complete